MKTSIEQQKAPAGSARDLLLSSMKILKGCLIATSALRKQDEHDEVLVRYPSAKASEAARGSPLWRSYEATNV